MNMDDMDQELHQAAKEPQINVLNENLPAAGHDAVNLLAILVPAARELGRCVPAHRGERRARLAPPPPL